MANLGQLTVTPEELDAQATAVEAKLSVMKELFEDVNTLVSGTESYWIGMAGDAHRESYHSRMDGIQEMLRRYEEHVRDLRRMAGVYQTAEKAATFVADTLPTSQL